MLSPRQWIVLITVASAAMAGAQSFGPPHASSVSDPVETRSLGEIFPEYFFQNDSDKDGLSDEYEFRIGTSANSKDTDGDGWPDGAEDAAGSDPLAPDDLPSNTTWGVPRIQVVVPGAGATPQDMIFRNGFEPTLGVYTGTDIFIQITRPAQEQTDDTTPNVSVAKPPSIQITRPAQEKLPEPANVTIANPTNIAVDWEEET